MALGWRPPPWADRLGGRAEDPPRVEVEPPRARELPRARVVLRTRTGRGGKRSSTVARDFSEHARDESAAVLKRWKLDPKKLGETLRAKMARGAGARAVRREAPDGVISARRARDDDERRDDRVSSRPLRGPAEDAAAFAKRRARRAPQGAAPRGDRRGRRTLEGALAVVEVDGAEMIGHGTSRARRASGPTR